MLNPALLQAKIYASAQSGSVVRLSPSVSAQKLLTVPYGERIGIATGQVQTDSSGNPWIQITLDTVVGPTNKGWSRWDVIEIKTAAADKALQHVKGILHNDQITFHRLVTLAHAYTGIQAAGKDIPPSMKNLAKALATQLRSRQKFLIDQGLLKQPKFGALPSFMPVAQQYVSLPNLQGLGIAPLVIIGYVVIAAIVASASVVIVKDLTGQTKKHFDDSKVGVDKSQELMNAIQAYVPAENQKQVVEAADKAIKDAYGTGFKDADKSLFEEIGTAAKTVLLVGAGGLAAWFIVPKLINR